MPTNARTRLVPSRLSTTLRDAAQVLAALATTGTLVAQMPQASYPLLTDLNDATGINGPMTLMGNTPPAPPNNGVCVNGVYLFSGGQDARTPNIGTLDTNDFQIDVDFQVAALPGFTSPILVGGTGWRWIGFLVQTNGTLGILHNNAMQEWSGTVISLGTWYSGTIKYEAGNVELHLNGALVHQANIGPLNTGNNLNFTTNNFSNGTAFNGCIRNLRISNDTTLGMSGGSVGTAYCTAAPNSMGVPGVISGSGTNVVANNDLTLDATALPNNSFGFFLTSTTQGFVTNPGGSAGNLCLSGAIGRYVGPGQIKNSGATGSYSLLLNLGVTPQPTGAVAIAAGQTWNFQSWYRDVSGGAPTSNFTNGLSVTFQ